jgi:hypothetical protein
VYAAYKGMQAVNQDFSWKDFFVQGGISALVNIITHKNFMPVTLSLSKCQSEYYSAVQAAQDRGA